MTARETLEQLIDRAEVMLMSRSYPPNAENLAADLDERTQLGYDLIAALRAAPAPTDAVDAAAFWTGLAERQRLRDAATFIEMLIGGCSTSCDDEGWQACPRCKAFHELERGRKNTLAARLLAEAAQFLRLRAAPAPEGETPSRVQVLEAAIAWALGESDTFPEEPPPLAGKYRQRYWWRSELRRRAEFKGHNPAPASPGPTPDIGGVCEWKLNDPSLIDPGPTPEGHSCTFPNCKCRMGRCWLSALTGGTQEP
jgi:hypothetical protein